MDERHGEITGNFTDREAINLANVLNNPLDLPLGREGEKTRSGRRSPRTPFPAASGPRSSARRPCCGFMITYYTVGGLISVFTLAINLVVILGVMANIGATLTLPGLAGIVLTIGMAVDANILIYERMREELNLGKTIENGEPERLRSRRSETILDAHITQLSFAPS